MVLVVLSVLVGVTLGLLGGGGSILTTPILLYVAKLPAKEAIATSLLVVGATAAFSAFQQWRAGQLRVSVGLRFAAASMAGAYLGGRVAGFVPGEWLLAGFVALMAVAGGLMLRPRVEGPEGREAKPILLAVVGVAVGFVTGLVGAGGGFVVVPALALVGGLPMRAAIGTSLLVIALQAFAGLAGHLGHVTIDPWLAFVVTGSALSGSTVGTKLARCVAPASLRRAFGVFVLVMAAFTGFKLATSGPSGTQEKSAASAQPIGRSEVAPHASS